jgi:hypothetical protein
MKQNFSFAVLIVLLLSGLGWWGKGIEGATSSVKSSASAVSLPASGVADVQSNSSNSQREVLEALDHLVSYELYYRSVYGRFTKILSRVGFVIPRELAQLYEIRVSEATEDRLLVTAFSEVGGRLLDQVSINQDFEVRANFRIPAPRLEFLRARAMKHLRVLRDALPGQIVSEKGVFKDYFRYEVRTDANEHKVAFAVGIRPPVIGLQLEYGSSQNATVAQNSELEDFMLPSLDAQDLDTGAVNAAMTGQRSAGNVMTPGEEAYLAQKIFQGEMGRHAKTLTELSRIVNFQFKDKKNQLLNSDELNQEAERQPAGNLVIEPVDSD